MATSHPPETNFGTVTSWLPLTTAFPYVSGCSSALWARVGYTSSQFGDAVAFDPGYGITVDPGLICMPSQATLWWETETAPTVDGVATLYSIGPIVCPEAHTTAGTSVVNADSTFVACCPSSYTYRSLFAAGLVGECASPVTQGQVVTYVSEKQHWNITAGLTTVSTTMTADFSVLGVQVNGYNFATPTAQASTSSNTLSYPSVTGPAPNSTGGPPPSGTSGPVPGRIAGIAVGVVVLVILLVLAFVFRRRFKRKAYGKVQGHALGDNVEKGELGEQEALHELHTVERPVEIDDNARPSELPA